MSGDGSGAQARVGFVINQVLGFVTYTRNLEAAVGSDRSISPVWMPVMPTVDDVWQRVPSLTLRMALRAESSIRALREPLDCLFVCTPVAAMFATRHMRRVPTVLSLDATPADFDEIVAAYGRRPPGALAGWIKERWYRRIYSAAHTLVAWSHWAARSVVRDYGVEAARVEVINPGVDVGLWSPAPASAGTQRPMRLLFVGGDFERKGGHFVLEALRSPMLAGAELDVVSNAASIDPGPRVRVHRGLGPNSPELRALFRDADLFVLPTLGDTNPFVIFEAMACGLPVVSTSIAAIPEQVEHGVTGLLVPPGDPAALTAALESLAADPARRRAMGAAGRRRVEERFDARVNASRLFEVLRRASRAAAGTPERRQAA
jgi:glycosyltransferase involved in cell wall biosynthesis